MSSESPTLEEVAETFRALGHPNRLAIILWLLEEHVASCPGEPMECAMKPATCDFTDLVDRLEVTKATLSHHVKKLSEAGLLRCEREGRSLRCAVNVDRLAAIWSCLQVESSSADAS
mgnify:CR=1 FL=1